MRNATSKASAFGSLGLSNTDDLLNLQADGTVYLAPGVTITGLDANGKLDLAVPHIVTIDVSQIARGQNLSLDFNLTTFGKHNASVTVANVVNGLTTGPVAIGDTATVVQGASVLIPVLANDGGDGLTLTSVTTPTYGAAIIQNGAVLYTAPASYAGPDSFSYTETDSSGATGTANVDVTVQSVASAPVPAPVSASVVEGNQVTIDALAQDAPGLTLTAATAPQHGAAAIVDGEIVLHRRQWLCRRR